MGRKISPYHSGQFYRYNLPSDYQQKYKLKVLKPFYPIQTVQLFHLRKPNTAEAIPFPYIHRLPLRLLHEKFVYPDLKVPHNHHNTAMSVRMTFVI